ncbi:MAG: hypothetical protein K8R40_13840 [Anaerolineaceae bacterium]|nr:hypothetical protein [Anaerolineaceae bacterium]
MKKKYLLLIMGLIFVALNFMALQIAARFLSDYEEYTYKTYADALSAGAIDRGWIPDFIPETAKDIHLGYNIDTNDIALTFNKGSADLTEVPGCTPTKNQGSHSMNPKWWSDSFYDDPTTRFFQCDSETWLAINEDAVWYWNGLEEITIEDLTRRPKKYLHLDGKEVMLVGYVDFANIFDTRVHDDRDSFALVPNFDKVGENTVFVQFDRQEDAFTLFDEIYKETPSCDLMGIAIKLAVRGTLHTFEMPMNFNTAIGYNLQLHDLDSVTFLADMGDPQPSSQVEFLNRIELQLPNARYPLKLASKGWGQLQEGFAVAPVAEDSASSLRVTLYDFTLGDLNNDDFSDISALLIADAGGSGTFFYLTAALGGDDGILPVDTIFLGDRILVTESEINEGEISITYWTRPEDIPMSAEPTVKINARYILEEGHLVEVTAR